MSQSNCTMCGPTGPLLETHVVVALLHDNERHADELLAGSYRNEIGDVLDLAGSLQRVGERAAERLDTGRLERGRPAPYYGGSETES